MDNLTIYDQETFEEIKKCQKSPHYFATNYLVVDGKKFTTLLTEKEFNELYENVTSGRHEIIGKRRK